MLEIDNISSNNNITKPMEIIKQYTIDFFYQVKTQLEKENLLFNLDSLPIETQDKIKIVSSEFDTGQKGSVSTFKPEEWRKKKPAHLFQKVGQSNEEAIIKKINQDLNKISDDNWETIIESIKIQYLELENCIFNFEQTDLSEEEILNEKHNLRKKFILPILENIYMKSKIQPIYCPYYIKLLLQIPNQDYIRLFIKDKKTLYLKMIHSDLASEVEENQWQVIDKGGKRKKKSTSPSINLDLKIDFTEKNENNQTNTEHLKMCDPSEDYESFCQANKFKISQQGASQFMGELFKVDKSIFTKDEIYYCYLQFYNNINGISQNQIELTEQKIEAIDENILYFTSLVEYTLEEALKYFSIDELKEIFDKVESLDNNTVIPAKQRFKLKDLIDYFYKKIKNNKKKPVQEYKKKSNK
jgi:hypothetical protein